MAPVNGWSFGVMLDLATRGHDVRALVNGLESWVIACLLIAASPDSGGMACLASGWTPVTACQAR